MVMRCEVVGGAQGLAEQWAECDDELRALESSMCELKNKLDGLRQRKDSAAKALTERALARTSPRKHFESVLPLSLSNTSAASGVCRLKITTSGSHT